MGVYIVLCMCYVTVKDLVQFITIITVALYLRKSVILACLQLFANWSCLWLFNTPCNNNIHSMESTK